MRSVGFDSLVPSAGSMTRNDTRSDRCPAQAVPKHRFLCISLPVPQSTKPTPVSTCRSPPGGGGVVRAAPIFLPPRLRLRPVLRLRDGARIELQRPPMTPDFVPPGTHAADPQARAARRKRLIFAVVAGAVLVAVIAWAM